MSFFVKNQGATDQLETDPVLFPISVCMMWRLVATRVFKEITLVGSNQSNYFENANAYSKRTLKTRVATRLKATFEKQPPGDDGHYFGVPRLVVVLKIVFFVKMLGFFDAKIFEYVNNIVFNVSISPNVC